MIKFKKITLGCAIALSLLSSTVATANCVRHIVNDSDAPWVFTFHPRQGNVYFYRSACNTNGPCVINPHTSIEIEYTHSESTVHGIVSITDAKQVTREFDYYNRTLWSVCPRVDHRGSTGSVYLNDPANGDFTVGADGW